MTGHFLAICPHDCRRLLADAAIGRVAWSAASGPQVLPVTITLDGESVFFVTDPDSVLNELAGGWDAVVEIECGTSHESDAIRLCI